MLIKAARVIYFRVATPNSFIGQCLILARACVQLLWLLISRPSRDSLHFARLAWKVNPKYTMMSIPRLKRLYDLVRKVNSSGISGDIVECGVWNGGSSALVGVACRENPCEDHQRKLWLFDSFAGLPTPGERDSQVKKEAYHEGWLKGHPDYVEEAHVLLGNSLDDIRIIQGWFDESLPKHVSEIPDIALLHVDADLYDSVTVVLETLFEKVVPGGFIVLDDYGSWSGGTRAVDDFLERKQLRHIEIVRQGRVGAYIQMPNS